jgi:hypothetical protein
MDTQTLTTERLVLEPLRVEHAEEMAPVLDDPGLHDHIGGKPPTLEQLRRRYRLQVVGRSPDGSQRWLNWILRSQESGRVVGFVQATVTRDDDRRVAEIAWVVATAAQGRGYAKEATHAMVSWPQSAPASSPSRAEARRSASELLRSRSASVRSSAPAPRSARARRRSAAASRRLVADRVSDASLTRDPSGCSDSSVASSRRRAASSRSSAV